MATTQLHLNGVMGKPHSFSANLQYPQPSVVLEGNIVRVGVDGVNIGPISIRGLSDITLSDPRFEISINSESVGFIDGILKIKDGQQINDDNNIELLISGTVLLDGGVYEITFSIVPLRPHVPARMQTTISWQLEVITGNKILVPGCEPTSALSSTTLSSYLAEAGCGDAIVDLQAALDAIPGSFVKLGANFNRGNMRQKWFVLPPVDTDCPCDQYVDYYAILKDLANEELPVEESFDACDVIGQGFCPSPGFDEVVEPCPNTTYVEEGTFPAGVGVLPPVPPWALNP